MKYLFIVWLFTGKDIHLQHVASFESQPACEHANDYVIRSIRQSTPFKAWGGCFTEKK